MLIKDNVPFHEDALGVQIKWSGRCGRKVQQQSDMPRFDVANNGCAKADYFERWKETNSKIVREMSLEEENTNFNNGHLRNRAASSPLRSNHVEIKERVTPDDDRKHVITERSGENYLIMCKGSACSDLGLGAQPDLISVDDIESASFSISDDDSINVILAKDSDSESNSCELPLKSTMATTAMVAGSMLYFLLTLNKI